MKKKLILLHFILISLFIPNAYALTEQLSASKSYLTNQDTTSLTIKSMNENIIVDSHEIEVKAVAVAPNKELKLQNKSILLNNLQSQIGLKQTGLMDDDTLKYIQKFQEENSFNITNTLDYNTWFALFEQNQSWKNKTVQNAEQIWQTVLQKQVNANTSKFIVVNIPTMTLTAYDWDGTNATEAINSKIVVGKPSTQTPIKDFQILSIKYNPTWTPTTGILKRGAYKNGSLDTKWVKSHGLQILDSNNQIVLPENILNGENYRFQQPAGDKNALGILKFETNSADNIYLHDTNEKNYFNYNTRAYSSGCIRVQSFKELANWIKNSNDVEEKLKRKDTYYEKLNKTPVYITYTQVIFYEKEPLFAPDIYNKNNNTEFQK